MNKVKKLLHFNIIICFFCHICLVNAKQIQEKDYSLIIVDQTKVELLKKSVPSLQLVRSDSRTSILKIENNHLEEVQETLHEESGKCGNYTYVPDGENGISGEQEAIHIMNQLAVETQIQNMNDSLKYINNYAIKRQSLINSWISKVQESNIKDVITDLSSFPTRYYQSNLSLAASKAIRERWRYIMRNRRNSSVEFFWHSWRQPSVIAMIKGKNDKYIIIGGHLDSINSSTVSDFAPGADDNASGIATLTEILRVIEDDKYEPVNNIVVIGYAAEEVGLRGSADIAKFFRQKNRDVIGVLQLDMTNFNKANPKNIYLTTDYTDAALTNYVDKLAREYLKIVPGKNTCGYGCSDHASWFKEGYPSVNPFEADWDLKQYNTKIHTVEDTLMTMNNNANHSLLFAKLGLAFVGELDVEN